MCENIQKPWPSTPRSPTTNEQRPTRTTKATMMTKTAMATVTARPQQQLGRLQLHSDVCRARQALRLDLVDAENLVILNRSENSTKNSSPFAYTACISGFASGAHSSLLQSLGEVDLMCLYLGLAHKSGDKQTNTQTYMHAKIQTYNQQTDKNLTTPSTGFRFYGMIVLNHYSNMSRLS